MIFRFLRNTITFTRNASKYNVLLPKTSLPLRIASKNRKERDLWIMKAVSFESLYNWQRVNQAGKEFILHDGPPYANGKVHIGHALNKILKDFVLRHRMLSDQLVHYVPGWDCHGLPIELKALASQVQTDPLKIRSRARTFAEEAVGWQKEAFVRWGIVADWQDNCYHTFTPDYVAKQLKLFGQLYGNDFVYRDYKPVYWSPSSRSALAESELEYKDDHQSPSIYLKLELKSWPKKLTTAIDVTDGCIRPVVYLIVWTTTPWTLPANQAVCYHPDKSYVLVRCQSSGEYFVVASELCPTLEKLFSRQFVQLHQFQGDEVLNGEFYYHPMNKGEAMPLLPSHHVTTKKGTGLVHTAPAHGPDDFLVALKHKLAIVNLVNEEGRYGQETGHSLDGLDVLTDGQETVLKAVEKEIVHRETYVHSYPYDWRTKLPVIIRASRQWFIDTDRLKTDAIEAMKEVTVVPANFEKPMLNQLAQRPYWCISRQRSWGVPIPVFYHPDGRIVVHPDMIDRLCHLVASHGADCWWTMSADDLIGPQLMEKYNLPSGGVLTKGMDIMDIWFDSGVSWNSVLPNGRQADLYLEGVDQFGGWFQSSLLTSVASNGRAPYKNIFVHGFVLDGNGRKMSKSEGNVVDPMEVIDSYGIDSLRWWVANHVSGSGGSVSASAELIQQASQDVQKLRSVLRFLLANLPDNGTDRHSIEHLNWRHFGLVDRYLLHSLSQFVQMVQLAYGEMNYRKVTSLLLYFVGNDVSALYTNVIKHRLYCFSEMDEQRMAALYVLSEILDQVTLMAAPILPHLMEEIEIHHPWHSEKGGLFRNRRYIQMKNYDDPQAAEAIKPLMELRNLVNKAIGRANSLEWNVLVIIDDDKHVDHLHEMQRMEKSNDSDLCQFLQVAMVTIVKRSELSMDYQENSETMNFNIDNGRVVLSKTELKCCPRCRRFTSIHPDSLCPSCLITVNQN